MQISFGKKQPKIEQDFWAIFEIAQIFATWATMVKICEIFWAKLSGHTVAIFCLISVVENGSTESEQKREK